MINQFLFYWQMILASYMSHSNQTDFNINSGEPFAISTKIIRKMLAAIGKNKSIGPHSVSGEILKLGGEAMIPYLAPLLDITVNNATIPSDWKKAIVFPIYKGGDRSLVTNNRPVS
jgi:hypothetical protein